MDVYLVENEYEDFDFRDFVEKIGHDVGRRVEETHAPILQIIDSLGGATRKYRRERDRALGAVLSELYSLPRVNAMAKMCPSYGILPGFALDLTTQDADSRNWNFDDPVMRKSTWNKIDNEKPLLIVGSPMCTAFSAW